MILIICITAVLDQHLIGLSSPHLPGRQNICSAVVVQSDATTVYSKQHSAPYVWEKYKKVDVEELSL